MPGEQFLILLVPGVVTVIAALLAVTLRDPVKAVVAFALSSAGLAIVFFILSSAYVAVLELTVGAGLVAVLFLVAIVLSGGEEEAGVS